MITDNVGLYVHIPFCLKKCAYCDFSSYSGVESEIRDRYVSHLISEIRSYSKHPKIKVDTVFFGGGTPSLLTPREFEAISEAIHSTFLVEENTEFTMEANPGTVTRDNLPSYIASGVNRISMGVQSINDNELKILGRIHTADEFLRAYEAVRACGVGNVNVDVMYGIPEQTRDSFRKTLNAVISASPEHVSAYGLMLEEGTPFWDKRGLLPLPTEDEECDMYYYAAERLSSAGYSHYEISNYAKAGYECKHNLKYWRCEDYIGVGLSAHSSYLGKRFSNPTGFNEYFAQDVGKHILCEQLDADVLRYEYVMLRLRLAKGFSLSDYERRFSVPFLSGREGLVDKFRSLGYLEICDDRLFLTERGFYVSNSIISELL